MKRIKVEQLRTGMFLQEFCGSWMDHPFWRSKFLLENPEDIKTILASSIREVWIDTSKGLDVEDGQGVLAEQTEEEIKAEAEHVLTEAVSKVVERGEIAAEMERAAKICSQAKQAVS